PGLGGQTAWHRGREHGGRPPHGGRRLRRGSLGDQRPHAERRAARPRRCRSDPMTDTLLMEEPLDIGAQGSAAPPPPPSSSGPLAWVQRRMEGVTSGADFRPLLVLFFIYFFDEFATAAFGVL